MNTKVKKYKSIEYHSLTFVLYLTIYISLVNVFDLIPVHEVFKCVLVFLSFTFIHLYVLFKSDPDTFDDEHGASDVKRTTVWVENSRRMYDDFETLEHATFEMQRECERLLAMLNK